MLIPHTPYPHIPRVDAHIRSVLTEGKELKPYLVFQTALTKLITHKIYSLLKHKMSGKTIPVFWGHRGGTNGHR